MKLIMILVDVGALDVVYRASMGTLNTKTTLANQGSDFNSTIMTLRFEDGQQSATISVPIIDVSIMIIRLVLLFYIGNLTRTLRQSYLKCF